MTLKLAATRIRQAIQYGEYKAWNNDAGEQKAQAIIDNFHNGEYGSKEGFWVQVHEAVEFIERLSRITIHPPNN